MPHEGTSLEPVVEHRGDKVFSSHRWKQTSRVEGGVREHLDLLQATQAVAQEVPSEQQGTLQGNSLSRFEIASRILDAVQAVARECDGANSQDLKGFSAGDTAFGRALAFTPVEQWEPETVWEAHRMLRKYRKQLDSIGVPYDSLPTPEKPASEQDDKNISRQGRDFVKEPYNAHVKAERKAARDAEKQRQREVEARSARKIVFSPTDNEFIVTMDRRDHDARDALKADVPGRRFDWEQKVWVVPARSVEHLMSYASCWDFQFSGGVQEKFMEATLQAELDASDPDAEKKKNGVITLVDGKLFIKTPYDPQVVSDAQGLPGRRWDGEYNVVDPSAEALEFAERHNLYIDEGIKNFVSEQERTKGELSALSNAHTSDLHLPDFHVDLYDYQKAGVAYALQAKRTFLADEMGLGKTVQAIGVVHAADAYPSVVVCPATLKRNWQREFNTAVDGLNVVIVDGRTPVDLSNADVVVLNYDILQHHLGALQEISPKAAIFDESHYVKNQKAARTVAALALADTIDSDGYVLALTGTPVTNKTAEFVTQLQLLGQLEAVAPNSRNPVGSFLYRYCDPQFTGYGNTKTYNGATNSDELQEKLRSRCYVRRQKRDVLTDLPPKTRQTTLLGVKDEDLSEYRSAEKNFAEFIADKLVKELREERKAANLAEADPDDEYGQYSIDDIIDALDGSNDKYKKMGFRNKEEFDEWSKAKLKAQGQATIAQFATLRKELGKAKIPAAIERIDSFQDSTGRKAVIFAHHKEVVDALAKHYNAPKISGSVNLQERQRAVDSFQNDPDTKIIVCNNKAAAEGITLTAASDLFIVEQDWTPMDQAEARIDRIGQTQPVTIHYLLAADTMDEVVHQTVERKRKVVNAATDGTITTLDEGDDAISAVYKQLGL